jgi:hypothetical protein
LVTDAVQNEDAVALASLLRANPERMHFVGYRRAVQITACDGEVVAHYPVEEHIAERVAQF